MPVLAGDPDRPFGGADVVGFGCDRDLHRVVVAVVTALHLDDQVPTSDRPHEMHGIHGRLRARVGEAPHRQTKTSPQLLGHDDRVLGRLGEVGTPDDPAAHSLHDRRVSMPGQACTVAAVHVNVFGTVDVVDLRADAVADPHGLGAGDLPARGHPPGEDGDCTFAQQSRLGLAVDENLLLFCDDGVQPPVDLLAGRPRGLGQLDCHCYLSVRAAPVSVRRSRLSALSTERPAPTGHGLPTPGGIARSLEHVDGVFDTCIRAYLARCPLDFRAFVGP